MASASDRTAQLRYKCLAADNWSLYPAKSDIDLTCHALRNVESATFCDGTYMGPGGSFDISSGQDIVIAGNSVMLSTSGGNSMNVSNAGNIEINSTNSGISLTSIGATVVDSSSLDIINSNNGSPLIRLTNNASEEATIQKVNLGSGSGMFISNTSGDLTLGSRNIVLATNTTTGSIIMRGDIQFGSSLFIASVSGTYTINNTGQRYYSFTVDATGAAAAIELPLITATNLGVQYLITNINITNALDIISQTSQNIYGGGTAPSTSKPNIVTANQPRLLTAIQVASANYGWSMI